MHRTPTHNRNRGRLIAAALVAFTLLAAAVAARADAAKVPEDFFGVFAENPSREDFRGMGDAGFGVVRVPVNWAAVQSKRNGGFDWSQPDHGVGNAATQGLRPTLVVFGTPKFVHKSTARGLHGPESKADLKAWRKFSEALARRYGRGGEYFGAHPEIDDLPVRTWIAWNEENSKSNWLPKPDPRAYAKLVKAFDRGISKVDPKARIVLGGMYGYPRDPKSMQATGFLRRFYKARGIDKHFDAINSHPYGSGVGDVKRQISELRAVARRAGDRGVGLLVGELGWASKGPSRSELVVGRKGQAKRLRNGLDLLARKRNRWNLLGAYVYSWRDFPEGQLACNWCPWSGLVTKRSKPKPALKAVERTIRKHR